MKINMKIMIPIAGALVFTAAGVGTVSVWQIKKAGRQSIAQIEKLGQESIQRIKSDQTEEAKAFREEILSRKKEYLKSQVQTTLGVLEKAYKDANDPEKLKAVYAEPLKNAVNTAYSLLESIEKETGLPLEEKQEKAKELVQALRYGPENKDYFWINDMKPVMVMHPYKPELNGKDLSDNQDPNGKKLFVEFVNVCREKGEGFVDYYWPKYGADKPQPKLSFVKLFKPWNWVIGSGVYMEVAESKLKSDSASIIQALRYGPENKDYFWINDMKPIMVMHPYKPELNGKDLSDNQDPNGKKLFVEFVKVCREKGEGFVDYYWPKYGADKPQPKLSFVKLFKEWGWIIGTGLYIDDIDAMVDARGLELQKSLKQVTGSVNAQVAATKNEIQKDIRRMLGLISGITLVLLGVVLILSWAFTRRSIITPVKRITDALNEGAEQVASASQQVSSASQQLAGGASQQAASIEETSSSLEEMLSMTRQNADNANQANGLMAEAKQVVGKANESMVQLTASMEEISMASEETSKIIKTIDEIAFQTNLLALNAAVEAARAGEAGAGFAVVADEVRNLAMRAAEAARNTANLIEGTVKRVKDGSVLLGTTNQAFQEVSSSAAKVANLVAEIAAASSEQAQGIDQLNKAVAEMDKVVQVNAANAEESASASEELNAQAKQMNEIVGELVAMVGGGNNKIQAAPHSEGSRTHKISTRGEKEARAFAVTTKSEMAPDRVIPFDEKDFNDF